MGAWGAKAFENDSALDWLAELEAGGVEALRATLAAVAEAEAEEWIDVDDGSSAIAAAELVAAALGLGAERLPAEATGWLEGNPDAFAAEDLSLAQRAVARVLGPESELSGLWREGEPDNAWSADVAVLLARLEAGARGAGLSERRASAPPAKPRKRGGLHEKQALLTFLGMRGLTPTKEQLARIEESSDPAELRRWLARVVDAPSVAALLDG